MKLHLTIVTILTLLFATACGIGSNKKSEEEPKDQPKKEFKEGDNSQSQETDETSSEELSSASQEKESETKTIRAQFEMMVANTGGTFVVFKAPDDEKGVWYRVARETDDLDFAMGLQPGDRNSEFSGEWYEITYEVRTENRGGREQERPFILSAERVDHQGVENAQAPAINFENL